MYFSGVFIIVNKYINIALITLMFPAMLGFTVNQHFCKGELIDTETSFLHLENESLHHCCEATNTSGSQAKTCDTSSSNQTCPYCHDETRDVKIDDQFMTVNYAFDLPTYIPDAASQSSALQIAFTDFYANQYNTSRGPPALHQTDITFLMRFLL